MWLTETIERGQHPERRPPAESRLNRGSLSHPSTPGRGARRYMIDVFPAFMDANTQPDRAKDALQGRRFTIPNEAPQAEGAVEGGFPTRSVVESLARESQVACTATAIGAAISDSPAPSLSGRTSFSPCQASTVALKI